MDRKSLSLIGAGLLGLGVFSNCIRGENGENEETNEIEAVKPGIALDDFVSSRYKISFKYPKSWVKNPRYEEKYEGATGFFEVGDFAGVGENIDEAVKTQVDEDYKPYGSNPTIRSFVVDGEPVRVIYPSSDQQEFYKDKDAAIVLQYPKPVMLDGKQFDYVVIWASKEYVPLILSTLKFVDES